jgi:hypothetical protein
VLRLAAVERDVGADIVLHLVMVNERKLHLAAGYDSIFSYCARKLGFSKSTAYRRQAIVAKAGKIPQVAERLRDGRLQMCAAATIAQYLTVENADELLDGIVGLSHREVDAYMKKRNEQRAAAAAPVVNPCFNVPDISRALCFRQFALSQRFGAPGAASPRLFARHRPLTPACRKSV